MKITEDTLCHSLMKLEIINFVKNTKYFKDFQNYSLTPFRSDPEMTIQGGRTPALQIRDKYINDLSPIIVLSKSNKNLVSETQYLKVATPCKILLPFAAIVRLAIFFC